MDKAFLSERDLTQLRKQGYFLASSLLAPEEVSSLLAEVKRLLQCAPVDPGDTMDANGNPIEHPGDFVFSTGPDGKPVLNRIWFPMWRSQRFLEAYGNPRIHHAAHRLYGNMMVPFDESIVIKLPNYGAGFAWHQDGAFKTGPTSERGHNFGIYLTASTADNGALHVLPESHQQGILDLKTMVEKDGFDLPCSVLAEAKPGDANIHSRSIAHGSKSNDSPDLRVTWYIGFHHRDSIKDVWDEGIIQDKMNLIPIAVEARKTSGRYMDEEPFPYEQLGLRWPISNERRERALRTPALQI